MPLLDVSDLLLDPDFNDCSLICTRQPQTVGQDGRAVNTPIAIPFSGVVTSARGQDISRQPNGEYNHGSIFIISRFKLISGKTGLTADIVSWNGNTYTVVNIADYSRYGRGFTQSTCELIQLSG